MDEDEAQDVQLSEHGSVVDVPSPPPDDEPQLEQNPTNAFPPNEDHSGDRYYAGKWSGYANFKCPHCEFHTLQGPWAVDEHTYDWHPELSETDFDDVDRRMNA